MPGTGEPSDPEEIRVGRLTNPTVHIGLNQLRRVVNRLIETYGPPAEIAIELARELKLTDDDKKRLNRENNDNRLPAERRSEQLLSIGKPDNGRSEARLEGEEGVRKSRYRWALDPSKNNNTKTREKTR